MPVINYFYLKKENKIQKNLICLFFFLVLFFVGTNVYDSYGVSLDEEDTRLHGFITLKYIYEIFFPSQVSTIDSYIIVPKLREFYSNDHGALLDTFFAFVEINFGLNQSKLFYLVRHYICFIIFFVGVYFFYLLAKFKFKDWRIGILGSIFLVLSPRIFAESFYNNKDLAFMSLFIISLYCSLKFIYKPNFKHAISFAFTSALATDLRLMGIFLPVLTIFFILIMSLRNKLFINKNFFPIALFLILTPSFIIIFWPYLWSDPLVNFLIAFKKFSAFPWMGKNLYFGEYIDANFVPWHYSLVWILITTPLVYTLFFIFGFFMILKRITKRLLNIEENKKYNDLWRGKREMLDFMIFLNFFLPAFLVIILNSTLSDGWRHLYFIYPSFLLISLYGFERLLRNNRTHKYIISFTILCILINIFTMIKIHPYQYVYFNFLAGKNVEKRFDADYWALSNKQALEFILLTSNKKSIKIYQASNMNLNTSKEIFSEELKENIHIVSEKSKADFIISNGRYWGGNPNTRFAKIPDNFTIYKEIITDRVKIVSIFKREF